MPHNGEDRISGDLKCFLGKDASIRPKKVLSVSRYIEFAQAPSMLDSMIFLEFTTSRPAPDPKDSTRSVVVR